MHESQDIDFIITWVDGSDPDWRATKAQYQASRENKSIREEDTRSIRYRKWDTLRYLFRGIEAYAP